MRSDRTRAVSARRPIRRRLVRDPPTDRPRGRRLPRALLAGEGALPAARRRHRNPARRRRVARGRRRGAAPLDLEPRRSRARDRDHELRRDRARGPRDGHCPSRVREALRRDRVSRRAHRHPLSAPTACIGRARADRRAYPERRRRTARLGRMGNRSCRVPRPRPGDGGPDRARRPTALGPHGRRARSRREPALPRAPAARRVRAHELRDRRRRRPTGRARARAEVPRLRYGGSRDGPRVHPRADRPAASRARLRRRPAVRALGVTRLLGRPDPPSRRSGAGSERARAIGTLAVRHFG